MEFRIRGWNQVCLDDLALPDMVMSCGRKAKLVSRAAGIQGESVVPGAGLVEHQRTHGGRDEDFTNHQLLQQLFARCVFRFFTSSSGKIVSKLSDGGEAHVAASNDDSDVWCLFTVRSWRRNERRHEGDNDSSDDCGFIRHSVGGGDRAHVEWIVDFTFGNIRHASRATTTSGVKLARPPKRLTLTVAPGGGNASAPVQLVVVFSTPSPRSPASFGWRCESMCSASSACST